MARASGAMRARNERGGGGLVGEAERVGTTKGMEQKRVLTAHASDEGTACSETVPEAVPKPNAGSDEFAVELYAPLV